MIKKWNEDKCGVNKSEKLTTNEGKIHVEKFRDFRSELTEALRCEVEIKGRIAVTK